MSKTGNIDMRLLRCFFILLVASFSPGVLFNISDNGLEQTAYGIFFAAAYLNFQSKPARSSFFALIRLKLPNDYINNWSCLLNFFHNCPYLKLAKILSPLGCVPSLRFIESYAEDGS